MRELQKKHVFRSKMYSLPVLFVLFVTAVLTFKGAYAMIAKERGSLAQTRELSAEYERLKEREKELSKENDRLKTMSGIEQEIKSKFNVARVGEKVAVIIEEEDRTPTTTPEEVSWWKRFWGGIISR